MEIPFDSAGFYKILLPLVSNYILIVPLQDNQVATNFRSGMVRKEIVW